MANQKVFTIKIDGIDREISNLALLKRELETIEEQLDAVRKNELELPVEQLDALTQSAAQLEVAIQGVTESLEANAKVGFFKPGTLGAVEAELEQLQIALKDIDPASRSFVEARNRIEELEIQQRALTQSGSDVREAYTNIGKSIIGAFGNSLNALREFSGENEELAQTLGQFQKVQALTAAAQEGLTLATNLYTQAQLAAAGATGTLATATKALLGPFGIVLITVGAVGAAFAALNTETDSNIKLQENLAKASREVAGGFAEEQTSANILFEQLKSGNLTQRQQNELLEELNGILPDKLKLQKDDLSNLSELNKTQQLYNQGILEQIRLESIKKEAAKTADLILQNQITLVEFLNAEASVRERFGEVTLSNLNEVLKVGEEEGLLTRKRIQDAIALIGQQNDELNGLIGTYSNLKLAQNDLNFETNAFGEAAGDAFEESAKAAENYSNTQKKIIRNQREINEEDRQSLDNTIKRAQAQRNLNNAQSEQFAVRQDDIQSLKDLNTLNEELTSATLDNLAAIVEDESKTLEERKAAAQQLANFQIQEAAKSYNAQLELLDNLFKAGKLTNQQLLDAQSVFADNYNQTVKSINDNVVNTFKKTGEITEKSLTETTSGILGALNNLDSGLASSLANIIKLVEDKKVKLSEIGPAIASFGLEIAGSLNDIFSSVDEAQRAADEARLAEIENQRSIIEEQLSAIDEQLSATNEQLTETVSALEEAEGARSSAALARFASEQAAVDALTAEKDKLLNKEKQLESEAKKIAAEQAKRDAEAEKRTRSLAVAQNLLSVATAAAAVAEAFKPDPASSAVPFGVGLAIRVAAAVAFVANLVSLINQVRSLEKGGVMDLADGAVVNGPSHSQGGVGVVGRAGQPIAEIEGGEVVLTKGVSRNAADLAVVSAINQKHGGRPLMANGGIFAPIPQPDNTQTLTNALGAVNLNARVSVVDIIDAINRVTVIDSGNSI